MKIMNCLFGHRFRYHMTEYKQSLKTLFGFANFHDARIHTSHRSVKKESLLDISL